MTQAIKFPKDSNIKIHVFNQLALHQLLLSLLFLPHFVAPESIPRFLLACVVTPTPAFASD